VRVGLILGVAVVLAMTFVPAPARADSVYWAWATIAGGGSATASGIASANLNSSGGDGLNVSGATVDHPLGVAIDSGSGKIYWTNFGSTSNYCSGPLNGGNTISFANLDGTGGDTLNTSGATVSGPDGLAIDPAARRIYWANDHANTISYANLDNSGGHDLNTAGATLNCPAGLAVDPGAGRVYWTNYKGNSISYANLDGSGGGDLPIAAGTLHGPYGLAIDAATGKIYWANYQGDTIGYANLDGSGGDILEIPGANATRPWGVAIDPAAGRIYWANNTGRSISSAKLDESGGTDLSTGSAPVNHPKYPVLLEAPTGAGAPVVSGGATTGSTLSCSQGTWASDLSESFLYRAPESFTYSWTANGKPIADASSSIIPSSPGRYACHVTATNYAGSTTQTSAAFEVVSAVSVTSWKLGKRGAVTLDVLVRAAGGLTGTATFVEKTTRLAGRGPRRHKITVSKTILYGSASLTATGAGTLPLTIEPTRKALKLLKSANELRLTLALAFRAPNGTTSHASLHLSVRAPPMPRKHRHLSRAGFHARLSGAMPAMSAKVRV
jgi:DNA-binding beta-propeller fold protein YncE